MLSNASKQPLHGESWDGILGTVLSKLEAVYSKVMRLEERMVDLEGNRAHGPWSKELSPSEEEKEGEMVILGKVEAMMRRMNMMEQRMQRMNGAGGPGPAQDAEQLRAWLVDKVRLPEYYDHFTSNGIDDLATAALLTADSLLQIGVDKIGHQMKIMNAVGKLRMNEGNTESTDFD